MAYLSDTGTSVVSCSNSPSSSSSAGGSSVVVVVVGFLVNVLKKHYCQYIAIFNSDDHLLTTMNTSLVFL